MVNMITCHCFLSKLQGYMKGLGNGMRKEFWGHKGVNMSQGFQQLQVGRIQKEKLAQL